jgi:hypothetical protein
MKHLLAALAKEKEQFGRELLRFQSKEQIGIGDGLG